MDLREGLLLMPIIFLSAAKVQIDEKCKSAIWNWKIKPRVVLHRHLENFNASAQVLHALLPEIMVTLASPLKA